MNILLNPAGSSGDVLPFIRLGTALKARGHDLTVITPSVFVGATERR
jgi:UDP:flavonoid glycosyltransferase YjiC (YdhE family)